MTPFDLPPHTTRSARRMLAIYWVLLAIGSHLPALSFGENSNQVGMFQVDKTLHVIGFAGLAWLLFRSKLFGRRVGWFGHAFLATLIAGGYALVDEYTQQWTGRDVSYSDVVAGVIGILGVFVVLTAPRPGRRAGWYVWSCRVLAYAGLAGLAVLAFAPQGNHWIGKVIRMFVRPWPDIDKAGHFYISAAVTLVLSQCYPLGVNRPRLSLFVTILAVGLSGPIIETVQSYTGRSVEMTDLYAHQLGLLAALAALSVLALLRAMMGLLPHGRTADARH